jgi:hypothetical protein
MSVPIKWVAFEGRATKINNRNKKAERIILRICIKKGLKKLYGKIAERYSEYLVFLWKFRDTAVFHRHYDIHF